MNITALKPRAEIELDKFAFDPYCKLYLPLWKLDGDSFMSKDVYGHVCTRYGDAHWTPQGWEFDGTADYIDCGGNDNLDSHTDDFTLEALIKQAINTDTQTIISTRQSRNDLTQPYSLYISTGRAQLQMGTGTGVASSGYSGEVGHLAVGKVYHVVGTSKNTTISIFVNGDFKNSGTFSGTRQTGIKMTIGTCDTAGERPFNGFILLAAMYHRALTPQEIQRHTIVGKELFA